jgi:hypothetical protein
MVRRPLLAVAVLAPLVACSGTPPDPAIGFQAAQALPASATYGEVIAAGGRVLGVDPLRTIVATMGDDAFLHAIGGDAGDRLVVREDAAVCMDPTDNARCRRIVADGLNFRVFALDGAPLGTLAPSRG